MGEITHGDPGSPEESLLQHKDGRAVLPLEALGDNPHLSLAASAGSNFLGFMAT